jgi:hypothetical protein
MGLAGASGAGCSAIAGIEDLRLTGSPDASADVGTGSSSGSGGPDASGSDVTVDSPADVGQDAVSVEASACTTGQTRCSGGAVETCSGGAWGAPVSCASGTCSSGACTGVCAPGQTSPVACGDCGTETQTCSASGTWVSGTCSGQGACAPNATRTCDTYGSQTCSSSCSWGSCSCPPSPVCTPDATQCSGSSLQTCDSCGQWGSAASCGTGMTCSGGACVPAATDCPGTFLVCDGFENGTTLGSQWYAVQAPGTMMVIDSQKAHTGSNALHISYPGGGATGFLQTYVNASQTPAFPQDTLYVRVWFYISVVPDTGGTLIALQSNANVTGGVGEMGFVQDTPWLFDDVEDLTSNNGGTQSSVATMPASSWTCLEFGIDTTYDATYPNGEEWVWQGASSQASYVTDLVHTPAQLQNLRGANIGIQFNVPTQAFDLYIDDVAIDASYIPCDE